MCMQYRVFRGEEGEKDGERAREREREGERETNLTVTTSRQARKHAPCIVYIDEVNAVGRSRG